MYGAPIQTQRFGGGFSGPRFQSVGRREPSGSSPMGVVVRPAVLPLAPMAPLGPLFPVGPIAPVIQTPAVYPPAVITPTGQILVTDTVASDENKVIAAIAILGLFGLAASIF